MHAVDTSLRIPLGDPAYVVRMGIPIVMDQADLNRYKAMI